LLDGDDYWIDDCNLQKKIEVLISNEKIIGCASITKTAINRKVIPIKSDIQLFNKFDIIAHSTIRSFYCHTSSLLWKNYYYNKKTKLPFPRHFGYPGQDGDFFLLHQMLNNNNYIYLIPEVLSIYNNNGRGAWSKLTKATQNKLNKKIKYKVFYYANLKYKFLYIRYFFFFFSREAFNRIRNLFKNF
jgi:hypothetical protein